MQSNFSIFVYPCNDESHTSFPPVLVAKAMRHIKIEVQSPLYTLDTLRLLADSARRLPNLHTLEVDVMGRDASLDELETVEHIQFQTRQLRVTHKHSTVVTGKEWVFDPKEMAVLGKLTLASKGKNVNQSLVRYNMFSDQKEVVDGWQQRQDWTLYCRVRITEENVWVYVNGL